MRILVLTSSYLAPTYDEKTRKQVDYINGFPDMCVELCNDLPLYEVEHKILAGAYDCVFPAVVFDRVSPNTKQFSFNKTLYEILLYHKQEYIGSDLYTQLLLNDKALTSFRSGIGLPGKVITRVLWENRREIALQSTSDIEWPVLVKPNTLSASMGISRESIAYSQQETASIIDKQFFEFQPLTEVLLEKYMENAREYTVSITGNDPWVIAAPTALKPADGTYEIYSFNYKRTALNERPIRYDTVKDLCLAKRLSDCAKDLAKKFSLRDYCRFDFLVDEFGRIFLIDANTIPSLGHNYMYPYTHSGELRMEQILALLLAVFSKRTGAPLPLQFLRALPQPLLQQLGLC